MLNEQGEEVPNNSEHSLPGVVVNQNEVVPSSKPFFDDDDDIGDQKMMKAQVSKVMDD